VCAEAAELVDGGLVAADGSSPSGGGVRLVDHNTAFSPGSPLTVAAPSGMENGDVLVGVVACQNVNPSLPSGWNQLAVASYAQECTGGDTTTIWGWKPVSTPEPSSYTFPAQVGAASNLSAIVAAFRGVDASHPDNSKWAAFNASPVNVFSVPTLAVTGADLVVLMPSSSHFSVVPGWTAPSGFASAGDTGFLAMFWGRAANAGTAGPYDVKPPSSGSGCGAVAGIAFLPK
jgi:hypothetical protein